MSLKSNELNELQEYLNTTVTSIDDLYNRFLKELMSEKAWQHYKIYNHRSRNPLYRWKQPALARIRHAQLGKGVATDSEKQMQTYTKNGETLRNRISSHYAISKMSKEAKEDVLRAYLTAVREHSAPKVPRVRTSLQEYLNTNKTSFNDLYNRFKNELITKMDFDFQLRNAWSNKARQRIISAANGNANAETNKFQATNGNATYKKLHDVIATTVDPKKKAAVLRAYTLAVERDEAPHLMREYNYYELSPNETKTIQKYLNTSNKSVNDLYKEFLNKVVGNWLETNALSPNALGRVLNARARSNVQARIMVGEAQQGANASKFPGLLQKYPRSQLIVAIRDPHQMLNKTPKPKRTQIKTAVLQAYMKAVEENMAPEARKKNANKTRNVA